MHFAQNRIDQTSRRALAREFDQFHTIPYRGVRGNPVEIAELKDAHAKREAYIQVKLSAAASGKKIDQEIELRLPAEAPEYNGFGQGGIAGG